MRLLLVLLIALPVAAQSDTRPNLVIDAGPFTFLLSPRETLTFDVELRNQSDVPATNVVVTTSRPSGGRITGARSVGSEIPCSLAADVLTCSIPRLVRGRPAIFDVTAEAPDRIEGSPFTRSDALLASLADPRQHFGAQ